GAIEIASGIFQKLARLLALQNTKKDRLDHVFRVLHAARDTVGRAVDQEVVLLEQVFEFLRERLWKSLAGHRGDARRLHKRHPTDRRPLGLLTTAAARAAVVAVRSRAYDLPSAFSKSALVWGAAPACTGM